MKTSKQLKEERALIASKIDTLSTLDNLTDEQTTELGNAVNEERSLTSKIEVALDLEKREAEKAKRESRAVGVETESGEEKEIRNLSFTKLVRELVESREGNGRLSGLELEVVQESAKEARTLGTGSNGTYVSGKFMDSIYKSKQESRAMVAGTTTAGGNFIPTEKVGFFEGLFNSLVFTQLGAQYLSGLSANTDVIGFTGNVTAGWATEIGTQTPTDATTAARQLRPWLLYGATDISRKLMIQINDSIDRYILQNIMSAMAVAFEAAIINGSGSSQPTGLLSNTDLQSVAIGSNGGAPTYAKILELIQKVETADGRNVTRNFLTNPKVVAKLKQTAIDAGSGGMVMGYNGLFASQLGVIDGYNVFKTANVPSNLDKGTTTGVCSPIFFGDFSQIVIGQFGGAELIVDPYTLSRTGQISLTVNSFMDATAKQGAALGVIKDLTTT